MLTTALHKLTPPPQKLLDTILRGLSNWEQQQYNSDQPPIPLFRGTVTDCHLAQEFYEQQDKIGWEHFLRGRISLKWSSTYRAYIAGSR
jgi:hypothetical protein